METMENARQIWRWTQQYISPGTILFAVLVVLKLVGLALIVHDTGIYQGLSRGFIILTTTSLLAASWTLALCVSSIRYFRTRNLSRQTLSSKIYQFGLALGICILLAAYALSLACFQQSYWSLLWVASDIWATLLLTSLSIRTISRHPWEMGIMEPFRLEDYPRGQESGLA